MQLKWTKALVFGVVLNAMIGTVGISEGTSTTVFEDVRWLHIDNRKDFFVVVSDQVTDGCWTSANASQASVELELIRSNGSLNEKNDTFTNVVHISAMGYGMGDNNCAVVVSLEVLVPDLSQYARDGHRVFGWHKESIWESTTLLTGGKNRMSYRIKETHVELVQQFLVELAKKPSRIRSSILASADEEASAFWRNQFIMK